MYGPARAVLVAAGLCLEPCVRPQDTVRAQKSYKHYPSYGAFTLMLADKVPLLKNLLVSGLQQTPSSALCTHACTLSHTRTGTHARTQVHLDPSLVCVSECACV